LEAVFPAGVFADTAFFAADFVDAAAFFVTDFLTAAFFAAVFLATAFFAAVFVAAVFVAAVFVAGAGAAVDFAFFAATFRLAFFATGCVVLDFFVAATLDAGALVEDALAFTDARFLAAGWLAKRFVDAPSVAPFVVVEVAVVSAELPSRRNLVRSLTLAIHAGGRAQPLQVWPVFGLRYLAGSFPLAADDDLDEVRVVCADVCADFCDRAPRGRPLRAELF
jgi:hypothetical protein